VDVLGSGFGCRGEIGKLRTLLHTKNMKNTCFYIKGKRYVGGCGTPCRPIWD